MGRSRARTSLAGRPLLVLYGAVALAPLLLAAATGLKPRAAPREFASALAMIALAILFIEFVLSGRFRRVSGRIGIDVTMRMHQLAAWVALAFLLVHPFLYGATARLFAHPLYASGVAAWVLLLCLVPSAWLRDRLPLRYEAWRASHGAGAALVGGLALHHALTAGRYAGRPSVAAAWWLLAAMAAGTLLWVWLAGPLVQRRHPWRVVSNRPLAERTHELVIEPDDGRGLDFEAGQFVWLNLGRSPFSLVEHPFSICSAPEQGPRLSFAIKESGDFTRRIGSIAPGTRAWVDGPHGHFTLPVPEPPGLVLVAGGVGIVPVLSILRSLAQRGWRRPVALVYGNRRPAQRLYAEELAALQSDMGLELSYICGDITVELLGRCVDAQRHAHSTWFACGPPAMLAKLEAHLTATGVPPRRLVTERFRYGA